MVNCEGTSIGDTPSCLTIADLNKLFCGKNATDTTTKHAARQEARTNLMASEFLAKMSATRSCQKTPRLSFILGHCRLDLLHQDGRSCFPCCPFGSISSMGLSFVICIQWQSEKFGFVCKYGRSKICSRRVRQF